jgi:hypothetical protein
LSKEAAGDYSGAMADLKLYQQFKLSDEDARKVQDKIYALDAKQLKAADVASSPAAQLNKLTRSLDGGVWRCVGSTNDNSNGGHHPDSDVGHTYIAVSGHTISGIFMDRSINGDPVRDVPFDPNAKPAWTVTLTSRKFNAPLPTIYNNIDRYNDEVTISDDGRSITENIALTLHDPSRSFDITQTRTYTRDR